MNILKYLKNPGNVLLYLARQNWFDWIPDQTYLQLYYRIAIGKKLNLMSPQTYNEKIQWLKLHDRNPLYTELSDKYEVRKYITNTIGEKYLIPLLGVWDNFDDIDFAKLPNRFVLKCTHDSGGVVICKNKTLFNVEAARNKINKCMKRCYFMIGREYCYQDIAPRIICEDYMVDESGIELKDYKFFCFNGKPQAMFVATDRGVDTRFDFFDLEFNHLPFMQHYKNSTKLLKKPERFEQMIKLAERLSAGIPHVRVDFYNIYEAVYFGELTFYHFSGMEKFEPDEYDYIFGEWLDLPNAYC